VKERLISASTTHAKVPSTHLPDPAESPAFKRSTWSFTSGANALRHQMKGKWPPSTEIYRERVRGWHLHVRVQDGYYRVELDNGNPDLGERLEHLVDLVVRAH
jgi:hypothetical protein